MENISNVEEIKALIALLDDEDEFIFENVNKKINELGEDTIPYLQKGFENSQNALQRKRLAFLLDKFKLIKLNNEITNWSKNEAHDLLKGLIYIAQFGFPNFKISHLEKVLDQLKEEIEPLIKGKSNYEIMQEMNKIILDKYQFGSNFKNYSGVNNSFINPLGEIK